MMTESEVKESQMKIIKDAVCPKCKDAKKFLSAYGTIEKCQEC